MLDAVKGDVNSAANQTVTFLVPDEQHWYALLNTARQWYGPIGANWQSQSKVRRKFHKRTWQEGRLIPVWFTVPDPKTFATWAALRYSIQVQSMETNNR